MVLPQALQWQTAAGLPRVVCLVAGDSDGAEPERAWEAIRRAALAVGLCVSILRDRVVLERLRVAPLGHPASLALRPPGPEVARPRPPRQRVATEAPSNKRVPEQESRGSMANLPGMPGRAGSDVASPGRQAT